MKPTKRRKVVAVALAGLLAGGLLIWSAASGDAGEWTFRKLVCRGATLPASVSNIRWERNDPFRLGILFDLGERVYRGGFFISADDFAQLQKACGFSTFTGDFVPGGVGPDPRDAAYEIYFRDVGQGQEFLWRQRGDTNAFYLQFNI